jgi:hypothetical protein
MERLLADLRAQRGGHPRLRVEVAALLALGPETALVTTVEF